MTETKCFRDPFRDQLHELSGQPNILISDNYSAARFVFLSV